MVHFKRTPKTSGRQQLEDAFMPVGIDEQDHFDNTNEVERAGATSPWERGSDDGFAGGGLAELEQPTVLSPIIKGARTHVTLPTTPVLAIPKTRQTVVISVPTDAQQNRDIKYAFDAQGIFYNVEEYPDVTHWYVPEDQAKIARSIIGDPGKYFGGGVGNLEGMNFLRDTLGHFAGMGEFGTLAFVNFSTIFSRIAPARGYFYYWGGWPNWTAEALARHRREAASASARAREVAAQAQQDPTPGNVKAAHKAKLEAERVAKMPPPIPAIPKPWRLRGMGDADQEPEAFEPVEGEGSAIKSIPPSREPTQQEVVQARAFAHLTAREAGNALRQGPYRSYRNEVREIEARQTKEAKQRADDLIRMGVEAAHANAQARHEMVEAIQEEKENAQRRAVEEANSVIESTAESVADRIARDKLQAKEPAPPTPQVAGLGQEPEPAAPKSNSTLLWVLGGIVGVLALAQIGRKS